MRCQRLAWVLGVLVSSSAFANGPETGIEGGAAFPVESRHVRLVREEVVLDMRDAFEEWSDGGRARCVYHLRNLSAQPVDITMGFLLNEPISPESPESWRDLYRMADLQVTQDGLPRVVTLRSQRNREFAKWYSAPPESVPTWSLHFAPHGESRVVIRYRTRWSGGCDGDDCMERMRYVTRPARLWAATIERARFELIVGDSGVVRSLRRGARNGLVTITPSRHRWTERGVVWEFEHWEPDTDLVFDVERNNQDPSRDPFVPDSLAAMPKLTTGLDGPIVVADSATWAWSDPRFPGSSGAWPEVRVRVRVLVGADGRVVRTRLPDPPNGMDDLSRQRASTWTFEPPRRRGEPVSAWADVVVVWPGRPAPMSTLGR